MKPRRAKKNPAPLWVTPAGLQFVTQKKKGAATVGDLIELDSGGLAKITAIDNRTRKIEAKPIDGANARGLDKARNAFRAFSGMEPSEVVMTQVGGVPRMSWLLGTLEEVLYRTVRDGKSERYLHPFKKSAQPLLVVDAETNQLCLVGGNYQVTERGITDH